MVEQLLLPFQFFCNGLFVISFSEKVLRLYGDLPGTLHLVEIQRGGGGGSLGVPQEGSTASPPCLPPLGLSLAGNRDLGTMSVFVVGLQPMGLAAADGRIRIGDELLEVGPMKSLEFRSRCVLL